MKRNIKAFTLLSLLIAILPFGLYNYCYSKLPNEVVIHYKNGVADSFINKSSYGVLVMCGLGLIGLLIMKGVEFYEVRSPQIDENQQNINIRTLVITIIFTGISFSFLIINIGINNFNKFDVIEIINIMVGISVIIIGNYMPKFTQNHFFGFRNKKTLSDKDIWYRSQRLCGKIWVVCGVIMILISLILKRAPLVISSSLVPFLIIVITILPYIYSKRISHIIK